MPKVTFDPNIYSRNDSPRCPICLASADVYKRLQPPDLFEGWCETCGDVNVTLAAAEKARNLGKAYAISAALKRRSANQENGTLELADIERIIQDTPLYTVLEKLDLMLRAVAEKTERN